MIESEFVFDFLGAQFQGSFGFVRLFAVEVIRELIQFVVVHIPAECQIPESVFDEAFQCETLCVVPLVDTRIGAEHIQIFGGGILGCFEVKIIKHT